MCYCYKEGQIFESILSHNFTTRNAGDMESKSVEHLCLFNRLNNMLLFCKKVTFLNVYDIYIHFRSYTKLRF